MTDLLDELIGSGLLVVPCVSEKQWMEFDTEQDYETAMEHLRGGRIGNVFVFD
jgi:NDP-sugar pyrophosphorylase family protein